MYGVVYLMYGVVSLMNGTVADELKLQFKFTNYEILWTVLNTYEQYA